MTTASWRLVRLIACLCLLAPSDSPGGQSPPSVLKGVPLRDGGAAPPLSCRDTVDPEVAKSVHAALDDMWAKGKSSEAVRVLEQAIISDPYLQGAYMALGTWYLVLKPSQALSLLNTGIERCPKTAWLYFDRANVYSKLGNPRASLQDLQRAHDLGHDSASLHYNLGNAHAKLRQFKSAIGEYEAALARDPQHKGAWRNLVVANIDGNNKAAALAVIDRILAMFSSGDLRQWALSARPRLERRR